jgi:hypothetical protein
MLPAGGTCAAPRAARAAPASRAVHFFPDEEIVVTAVLRRAAWWIVMLAAASAAAQEAELAEPAVRVDGNLARVDLELGGAFDDDFVEQLESGLPSGFVYDLELLRDHRWFDKTLETSRLQVVAMYDAATRGYLVNYKLDGKLVESRMVRELADVERAMTRIEALPAFRLDSYPRSWRLLVRARAAVGSRTVLYFFPARAITDWRQSPKFRSLNELPDES